MVDGARAVPHPPFVAADGWLCAGQCNCHRHVALCRVVPRCAALRQRDAAQPLADAIDRRRENPACDALALGLSRGRNGRPSRAAPMPEGAAIVADEHEIHGSGTQTACLCDSRAIHVSITTYSCTEPHTSQAPRVVLRQHPQRRGAVVPAWRDGVMPDSACNSSVRPAVAAARRRVRQDPRPAGRAWTARARAPLLRRGGEPSHYTCRPRAVRGRGCPRGH